MTGQFLLIIKNFLLRILLSKFLSKGRYQKIQNLSNNIFIHDLRKGIPYRNNSVDAVYHSHVLEHIDRSNVKEFLFEIFRVLKPNGIQRIVVPDFYLLCKSYINNYNKCNIENKISSTMMIMLVQY